MLIELKVKTELPVVLLLSSSFEWFKQVSDIIHGEQRVAQDSRDFHDGTTDSISSCKSFIHNGYMLERFICVFGINPDPQVLTNFSKNSFYLLPEPLRLGYFLTNY